MFGDWRTFYQATAEAAATLTGLVFVVATLTAGRDASVASQGEKLFVTPTIFHLTSVLVISALALTPGQEGDCPVALMTLWAVAGLVYAAQRALRIRTIPNPSHWSDFGWYGVAPTLTFAALAVASALAWMHVNHAVYGVALCLLVLLIVAIRNAWDLVTWLATRRDPPGEGPR